MNVAQRRAALLAHFDRHRRDLPWRRTRDPYAVWVSEIMLQQTRVETVVPYYERFVRRFPNPESLAAASEDEVLRHWSGLGYYGRARRLLAGVREVVARYGGVVPSEATTLRSLPGIGRYTAGAIASIAFDQAEPLVDGNVARVLARLHGIDGSLSTKAIERRLWSEAESLVQGERPGDLNQALMELGATVCLPRKPHCVACPVAAGCVALETGRTASIPAPKPRGAVPTQALVAIVATCDGGRRLAVVRSRKRLFGGLWGLPTIEGTLGDGPLDERVKAGLALHGLRARVGAALETAVTHILSHRRLEVEIVRATRVRVELDEGNEDARVVDAAALDALGVSRLTARVVAEALPSFGLSLEPRPTSQPSSRTR